MGRYNEENHLLNAVGNVGNMLRPYDKFSDMKRYHGIISNITRCNEEQSKIYEITPNAYGCKSVSAHNSEIRSVGSKALQIGDAVEYHIDYKTQKAFHVTAQSGHPFLCEYSNSDYSKYLRSKLHLSTFRRDFEVFDGCVGEGFISSFDGLSGCGTIEIIGMNAAVRYKNVLFHARDVDRRRLRNIKNQKVSFDLVEMGIINGSNNAEFIHFFVRNDLDLTKRAVNVRLYEIKKKEIIKKRKTEEMQSDMCINNERNKKLAQ